MTYDEIVEMIESVGVPAAYFAFDYGESPRPPFLIFYFSDGMDFYADDISYQKKRWLRIELYTDEKNVELEEKVEAALTVCDLPFTVTEAFIEDEQLIEEIYETEVIFNG